MASPLGPVNAFKYRLSFFGPSEFLTPPTSTGFLGDNP